MTMGDETLLAAMSLPVVIGPVLEELEKKEASAAAAQTLRGAFAKVESQYPGFTYDMLRGILHRADLAPQVDMCECLLRLEGINDSEEFRVNRTESEFRELNRRAMMLKKILSSIPDQIENRQKFLETIKDIANAIKQLLDAVNRIFVCIDPQQNKQSLEQRKKEFVKYSKNFSQTLKEFFKSPKRSEVFLSANKLVHQTNLIMKTVKAIC